MSNAELDKLKEKNEELEQEVFEEKIKGVKGQIVAMEEKHEIEFKNIRGDLSDIKDLAISTLRHVKATNGRVGDLEKKKIKDDLLAELLEKKVDKISRSTRAIQFMHRYPVVTTVVFLVGYLFTIQEIRDVVFDKFGNIIKLIF
jgi:hypothetical protein